MPRGHADYQMLSTQTVVQEQTSINSNVYDTGFCRSDGGGRLIWFDDFRRTLGRYELSNSAPGLDPALVYVEGMQYGFGGCVKFNTVGLNGLSVLNQTIGLPLSGKIGIEFCIYRPNASPQIDLTTTPIVIDGTNKRYGFYISYFDDCIYLDTSTGYVKVYTPLSVLYMRGEFIVLKLVFDPNLETYNRLWIGSTFVDLPYLPNANGNGGRAGQLNFRLSANCADAAKKDPVYLGYLAVSADEP